MQKKYILTISLALCAVIIFTAYILRKKSASADKKTIIAVCTTSMITDMVQQIGRNNIVVHGLMGPGVDPHLYRARESDLHKLAASDIIFYNGLHLEGKMAEVFASMSRYKKTVAVTDAITKDQLRSTEFACMYDPHVWHDVRLWMCVVQYISDNLIAIDPDHADNYQNNTQQLLRQLEKLDQYVVQQANKIPPSQRILITAHDAFGYFGIRYGFDVVGLQGLSTDSQIGTKDIQQLASFIVEKKIPVMFVESSIPQRSIKAVQRAVEARGWQVAIGEELFSDALGNPKTLPGSYIGMIRHNIDTIGLGLSGLRS